MAEPTEDHVWLGDLSGFQVLPDGPGAEATLYLYHRCGWLRELHPADSYLANIIDIRREHGPACLPPRSPEPGTFRDRMYRLAAGGS